MKNALLAAILTTTILLTGCGGGDESKDPPPAQPAAQPAATRAPAKKVDVTRLDVGVLTPGEGKPSTDTGSWPQFRGAHRDGIVPAADATGLYDTWPAEGPKVLWTLDDLCMGYSGAVIEGGRVFFNDYDSKTRHWMTRCVSLADGAEIWRWSYRRPIRPNHAITRTTPATDGTYVVSFDPKATLHGFNAATGERLWARNITAEYGARNPPWYNGQCPLLDEGRIIVGVGGRKALMAAFDLATGEVIWTTPNEAKHKLSHSSVMPGVIGGKRQYVWCTLQGMVGVDAADGKLLWEVLWTPNSEASAAKIKAYAADRPNVTVSPWRANTAVAPSPIVIDDGRIFMSAGYKAGALMLKISADDAGVFTAKTAYTLTPEQFNFDCHTPVLYQDHLFGVDHAASKKGQFACLGLDGEVAWRHPDATFGLGNWMLIGDETLFALDGDSGMLRMIAADTGGYQQKAAAAILSGHDVWAPMAYAGGKLILRDMGKMVCIEVATPQ